MIDEHLKNLLMKVGMSEKESLVYLALLGGGRLPISRIAAPAGLKRPIVYKIIEGLKQKGFVTEVVGGKVKVYSANDPIRILRRVENNADDLRFFIPMLKGIFQKHEAKPRIEFYEDKEGIKTFFGTVGLAKEAKYVSSYEKLKREFPEEIEHWIRSANANRTKVKNKQLIPGDLESLAFANRVVGNLAWEFRVLPEDVEFGIDFGIIDKKVVYLVDFVVPFIVLIHSAAIAESLSNFFDIVWKYSQPFQKRELSKLSCW